MIVVEASVALCGLLNDGLARQALTTEQVYAPHLVLSDVASGLRRGRVEVDAGWAALDTWRRLGMTRYAVHPMLERIWQLRDHVSVYDVGYVPLAEALSCALVTADARLSRAPGVHPAPSPLLPR